MGKQFVVGDQNGWKVGFDYQAWAADKTFRVGDALVFNYRVGEHNVFKVNGTQFQSCAVPPQSEALSSGSDSIVLATPGKKWYICGVSGHCNAGQKLVINVLDNAGAWPPTLPPSPSPSPLPAPLRHRGLAAAFPSWVPRKLLPGIFH
ncbi:hypothetical protein L6164_030755 [Bauhinia variegata]|uniref:Uncharacterized protein n=1 Tax=Bauhinia variegata TaxID=167791 RepID=A0ACB9LDQ0_BAUVA|nr:hypothetical protein L6164_030755 [Bauhinia variegata]